MVTAVAGKEHHDYICHFWDGSMETVRMLAVVLKLQVWQVRAFATSYGLPPASDAVHTRYPPETHEKEAPLRRGRRVTSWVAEMLREEREMQTDTKRCVTCGQNKPFDQFRRSPRNEDQLTKVCARCLDKQLDRKQVQKQQTVTPSEPAAIVPAAKLVEIIPENIPAVEQESLVIQVPRADKKADKNVPYGYYKMLEELVKMLPPTASWSTDGRLRWLKALQALLDLLVVVVVDVEEETE